MIHEKKCTKNEMYIVNDESEFLIKSEEKAIYETEKDNEDDKGIKYNNKEQYINRGV